MHMQKDRAASKRIKLRSIRSRVLLLASLIFVCVILLGATAIMISTHRSIESEIRLEADAIASQITSHLEYLQDEVHKAAITIGSDETVQKLYRTNGTITQKYTNQRIVRQILRSCLARTNYILGIDLIYDDGRIFSTDTTTDSGIANSASNNWIKAFLQSETVSGYSEIMSVSIKSNANMPAIAYACRFNNYYDNKHGFAVVVIYMKAQHFTETLNLNQNAISYISLTDGSSGNVYYETSHGVNPNQYCLITKKLSNGWSLTVGYQTTLVMERFGAFSIAVVGVALLLILVMYLVTVPPVRKWTEPINRLKILTQEVAAGNLDITCPEITDDEMGDLTSSFAKMAGDLKQHIDQLVKQEKDKSKLQMELQMAKINPHFIYNTLDSVIWLARMNRNAETAELCREFVTILQDTLHTDGIQSIATIKNEICIVRAYESIQKIRYGDRFEIQYEIDREAEQMEIPKLILQPIVQNALFHGILPNEDLKGIIHISIHVANGQLHIEVRDNGVGMSQQKIEQINSNEYKGLKAQIHSIGISNIRERLNILYQEKYSFEYTSKEGCGTITRIDLPTYMERNNVL